MADMASETVLAQLKNSLTPSGKTFISSQASVHRAFPEPLCLELCSSSRSVGASHHTLASLSVRVLAMVDLVKEATSSTDALRRDGTRGPLKVLVCCEDGYVRVYQQMR